MLRKWFVIRVKDNKPLAGSVDKDRVEDLNDYFNRTGTPCYLTKDLPSQDQSKVTNLVGVRKEDLK